MQRTPAQNQTAMLENTKSQPASYTVFMVPGSWHTPQFFDPLVEKLEAINIPTRTILLPSCNSSISKANPDLNAHDDSHAVHQALEELVEHERRSVLIAAHSYAAVPSVDAATTELSLRQRRAEGKSGGIVGILCFSGMLVRPNTALSDLAGGSPPSWIQMLVSCTCSPPCTAKQPAPRATNMCPTSLLLLACLYFHIKNIRICTNVRRWH